MYKVEGAEVFVNTCNRLTIAHEQTSCSIAAYFRVSLRIGYIKTLEISHEIQGNRWNLFISRVWLLNSHVSHAVLITLFYTLVETVCMPSCRNLLFFFFQSFLIMFMLFLSIQLLRATYCSVVTLKGV